MTLKIDLHVHTIASGDSQNTVLEYINRAKELGMDVIGFSDHGPNLPRSNVNSSYLGTSTRIPKFIDGVRVLKGVEANIVDSDEFIDIEPRVINKLDYVMANLHLNAGYDNQGKEKNTHVIINALKSGKIKILTHPFFTGKFDIDMGKVCEVACQNNVLLEVDCDYLKERNLKDDTISNLKIMISIAKRYNKKIIVNSDAHNIWDLADDSSLDKYKQEIGLTDDMIINNYPDELAEFLGVEL